MRIRFMDDSERALLARRLGQSDDVEDAALAASLEAWFEGEAASPPGGRRLTAADLEGLRAVGDYAQLDDRGPGNSDFATGYLGQG